MIKFDLIQKNETGTLRTDALPVADRQCGSPFEGDFEKLAGSAIPRSGENYNDWWNAISLPYEGFFIIILVFYLAILKWQFWEFRWRGKSIGHFRSRKYVSNYFIFRPNDSILVTKRWCDIFYLVSTHFNSNNLSIYSAWAYFLPFHVLLLDFPLHLKSQMGTVCCGVGELLLSTLCKYDPVITINAIITDRQT